jgi:hypothetical protein
MPSIISWPRSKADARRLSYYYKQIISLYGDDKLDENDIETLNLLRSNIVDAYSRGKLDKKHYESLKNEISIVYEKIFRNRIDDSLNNNNIMRATTTTKKRALDGIRIHDLRFTEPSRLLQKKKKKEDQKTDGIHIFL